MRLGARKAEIAAFPVSLSLSLSLSLSPARANFRANLRSIPRIARSREAFLAVPPRNRSRFNAGLFPQRGAPQTGNYASRRVKRACLLPYFFFRKLHSFVREQLRD